MDERVTAGPPAELPLHLRDTERAHKSPLEDARALTILATEHWSLLTARSLVYNETFARGGMFLTFLSATLVALGLVSAATGFSSSFLAIAASVLAVDLFVGIATYGRVGAANRESVLYLQGMNRLRHAYLETLPGLERYFVSGHHDDIRGVFGVRARVLVPRGGALHYFTTMPGMVAVICVSVAAALGADVLLLLTASAAIAGIGALLILFVGVAGSAVLATRGFRELATSMESIFPTPPE